MSGCTNTPENCAALADLYIKKIGKEAVLELYRDQLISEYLKEPGEFKADSYLFEPPADPAADPDLRKYIVRRQEVAYLIVEASSPADAEAKTHDEAFDEYDHTYDVTWTEELVKCPKGQAAD